jgi:hypothetical protein
MRLRRKTRSLLAIAIATVATLASFAVAPSLASWTSTDYDNGPAAALDCASPDILNTQASGTLLDGEVGGVPLTGNLAAAIPLTVTNLSPATASSPSGAAPATNLANDAWISALSVAALSTVHVTPSVVLPLSSSLAVATQYGRATAGGIATGASGAVNGLGDGTVAFQTTSPAVPTLPATGTLDLGTALSSVVGAQLSSDITQLSDASLTMGALGSITDDENGCQDIWQGIQDSAASVARSYLLAALQLNLTSSLVGRTTTAIGTTVTSLGTALGALEPTGTALNTATVDPATHTSLAGALTTVLALSPLPGVTVGVSGAPTVTAGVTFDLASIASLLTGTIGSGGVSLNLGTGVVSIDLAQILGHSDLDGLTANSSLLTTPRITAILAGITGAISTLINTTVDNAVTALITSATVHVSINTDIGLQMALVNVDALHADVELSGTLGDYVDEAHNAAPTVAVTLTVLPAASAITGLLNVGNLLSSLTATLSSTILPVILPLVDDLALTAVNTAAPAALATGLATLNGTPIATIDTAFGTVLGVVQGAVSITVNAQPDQSGGVGTPDGSSTTGQFFDSALVVGVLDSSSVPVLGLYFGSSSAGPVSLR